jgi:hypothetical protein
MSTRTAKSGTTPDGSKLLRLGRYASPTQVYQAMCFDYATVYKTKSITESAEEIAAAYYGWQFAGGSPAGEFEIGRMPLALLRRRDFQLADGKPRACLIRLSSECRGDVGFGRRDGQGGEVAAVGRWT